MICIEEQQENVARLEKIRDAAQVEAVIGVFGFFGGAWKIAAGVEEDADNWKIPDYPALMAGWDALCRIYATAPPLFSKDEFEALGEILSEIWGDFQDHGFPMEMPPEPRHLEIAA